MTEYLDELDEGAVGAISRSVCIKRLGGTCKGHDTEDLTVYLSDPRSHPSLDPRSMSAKGSYTVFGYGSLIWKVCQVLGLMPHLR